MVASDQVTVTFQVPDPGSYIYTDEDLIGLGRFVLEIADDERLWRDNPEEARRESDKRLAEWLTEHPQGRITASEHPERYAALLARHEAQQK